MGHLYIHVCCLMTERRRGQRIERRGAASGSRADASTSSRGATGCCGRRAQRRDLLHAEPRGVDTRSSRTRTRRRRRRRHDRTEGPRKAVRHFLRLWSPPSFPTDYRLASYFALRIECRLRLPLPLSIALPCSNMIALFYIYSTGRTGQSSAESVSEERKTCRQRGYRYVRQWRHGQCSDERLCRTRAVCTEFASASRDAPLCSPFAPIRRVPAAVRAGESRSDVDRVERGSQSDSAGSGPRLLLSSSHSFSFSCFIS